MDRLFDGIVTALYARRAGFDARCIVISGVPGMLGCASVTRIRVCGKWHKVQNRCPQGHALRGVATRYWPLAWKKIAMTEVRSDEIKSAGV